MKNYWLLLTFLVFGLTACGPSRQPTQAQSQRDALASQERVATTETEPSAQGEETAELPTASPTEKTVEITHHDFPAVFTLAPLQRIYDCSAGKKGWDFSFGNDCDHWAQNRFERPVSPEKTSYYPELDITQGEFGQDDQWYYTRIFVFSEGLQDLELDGVYGLEIDLDLDARGDILILAATPSQNPAGAWSVNGVQVWKDENGDVGGPTPMGVDSNFQGDGYETIVFDAGQGADPDLAWVQTYSDQPGLLEIAFKRELLEDRAVFEWWMWAMKEDLGASKYDPIDFYSEDSIYPLDNTCGWIFGASPKDLPNICETIAGPKPTPKPGQSGICEPPPGTCQGPCEVWNYETCKCDCWN